MRYVKNNGEPYNGRDIVVGDARIINPTEQQLTVAGYVAVEQEQTAAQVDEAAEALAALAEGDYRVIKCVEAFLTGEPLPYDIAALHARREALRAAVNGHET